MAAYCLRSNPWRLYYIWYNGNQAATGSLTAGTPLLVDANHYLNIGYNGRDNNYLNGAMDEVKIYNTNLSQANVQADMINTTASVPASLVYYYDFDNGAPGADNTAVSTILKDRRRHLRRSVNRLCPYRHHQ